MELDEVVEIHRDQIERYGGVRGFRDIHLLESALAMPRAGSGDRYFHGDIFEMAAVYLYHIVQNHPFVDGNKRTGAMAAFVFLKLNGITLAATNEALEQLVLAVAQGKTEKPSVAQFLRTHSRPRPRKR